MGRLAYLVSFAAVIIPGAASAVSLSSFSASALAKVALQSATFEATGGDALGALGISFVVDGFDDYPTEASGNADADGSFGVDELDGSVLASVWGEAGAPFGSAVATREGRLVGFIENESDTAIVLLFDYLASVMADFGGQSAWAVANARVELQDFFGVVFEEDLHSWGEVPEATGSWTYLLAPGETVYTIAYASALGDALAFAPEVIPAPAALPLILGALGGLVLVRRRARGAESLPLSGHPPAAGAALHAGGKSALIAAGADTRAG
jgi:hypothetical protein